MTSKKTSPLNNVEILIVEDSPTQTQQLKDILERHAYQLTIAHNGKEALAHLKKNKPALVINDIVMPEMDGYELCRNIKTEDRLRDIPVILLTSLSQPADIVRGLLCAADNFVTKPIRKNILYLGLKIFSSIVSYAVRAAPNWVSKFSLLGSGMLLPPIVCKYLTFYFRRMKVLCKRTLNWQRYKKNCWEFLLRQLLQRGLAPLSLGLVVIDGSAGLKKALTLLLPSCRKR